MRPPDRTAAGDATPAPAPGGDATGYATFRAVFGAEPAGSWAAPGRVNLIGEHTDYNDGYVLPFALPQRTRVAAARRDLPEWTVHSRTTGETVAFGVADLTPGAVRGWAGYVAGVVWAMREAGLDVPGARLAIVSDVPWGAGLSSSAALECAVLTALLDLGDLRVPVARRPGLARRAENGYVGMPCGIMDQSAAILSRAGHALYLDCRSGDAQPVPLDLAAHGMALLVVDTRAPHRLVSGEYAARRAACEAAARRLGIPALRDVTEPRTGGAPIGLDGALRGLDDPVIRRRVRHVVTENARVVRAVALLRSQRPADLGPLLTASHESLRDDFEVSTVELDTAVEAALAAGAHGARMTGAGFGGCALALVDAHRVEAVAAAVTGAFGAARLNVPTWFAAVPAAGASRLR